MFTQNLTLKMTAKMILGEGIVIAIMCVLFYAFDSFDLSVLFGGLLGGFLAVLYLFFICLGVNRSIGEETPTKGKKSLTISYYLRLFLLGVGLVIGLKLDIFNNIALIIPVLLMRPILMVAELIGKEVK